MKASAIFICCLLFIGNSTFAQQNIKIGQWTTYLHYGNTKSLVQTNDGSIYVATEGSIFVYQPNDNSIQTITRTEGLSDINIQYLGYDQTTQYLIIVYQNENIDLYKNGQIYNMRDLLFANIGIEKQILHINTYNGIAYLSTNFGIVAIDLNKLEVIDTYKPGQNAQTLNTVYQTAINDTAIFAATNNGLYSVNLSDNLWNSQTWSLEQDLPGVKASLVVKSPERLFTHVENTIFANDGAGWTPIIGDDGYEPKSAEYAHGYTVLAFQTPWHTARLLVIDQNQNISALWPEIEPRQAIPDQNGHVWVAEAKRGLFYTADNAFKIPDQPACNLFRRMQIKNSELWAAPGVVNNAFHAQWYSIGIKNKQINGNWNEFGAKDKEGTQDTADFITIAPHPSLPLVYAGSMLRGLFEINSENKTLTEFTTDNSLIQVAQGDEQRRRVSGLCFDQQQNLWIANSGATNGLVVKKNNGQWASFKIALPLASSISDIIVDDYDQKWIIHHRNGIVVANLGEDLENTSDDKYINLKQEANNGNLPSDIVLSIAKDHDGFIWVGTDNGIAVFYCSSEIFRNGCNAVWPYVEVDGQGAYLLQGENVNTIAIDGANRKWIGTNNGIWLFDANSTKEIHHFTAQNSPLLSNSIINIAIDQLTGEVYIATNSGLISYKADAIEGNDNHQQVLVYPNPVRPNYNGTIAIKGLPENAQVKITDIAGNLVYQTQSLGSQAVWNGKDYNGRNAATGVYLVFSNNEDGTDIQVNKLMIVR